MGRHTLSTWSLQGAGQQVVWGRSDLVLELATHGGEGPGHLGGPGEQGHRRGRPPPPRRPLRPRRPPPVVEPLAEGQEPCASAKNAGDAPF